MLGDCAISFLTGVAGSLHCAGMCGGFTLAVGAAPGRAAAALPARVLDQGLFHGGKTFTYAFLGAMGGTLGVALRSVDSLARTQAALGILSGVLLVAIGLELADARGRARALFAARRRRDPALVQIRSAGGGGGPAGPVAGAFAALLRVSIGRTGRAAPFFAGLFVGFVPCGLVYAAAARAAETADVIAGAATMAAFGLGTAPALLAVALGGALVPPAVRARLSSIAAVLVIALGAVALYRSIAALASPAACH